MLFCFVSNLVLVFNALRYSKYSPRVLDVNFGIRQASG